MPEMWQTVLEILIGECCAKTFFMLWQRFYTVLGMESLPFFVVPGTVLQNLVDNWVLGVYNTYHIIYYSSRKDRKKIRKIVLKCGGKDEIIEKMQICLAGFD